MQTGRRQFASRVFHSIVQVLFRMNIRDTQCGAKVIRRAAVEKIHSSLCIADMAFDINLLYVLKRDGFTILEVPTEWTDKVGSKVSLGRTSLTMLLVGDSPALDLFADSAVAEVFPADGELAVSETARAAAES